MKTLYLDIAELNLKIALGGRFRRLPDNYTPFLSDVSDVNDILCEVAVATESETGDTAGDLVASFDDLGFLQEVYRLNTGDGYYFRIYDTDGLLAATMQSTPRFSHNAINVVASREQSAVFGLNNMLMVAYAFSSAYKDTLMMHSSVVTKDGCGYLFLGKSGTGKSTHTSLWLRNIEGTSLLNDDNPVVRIVDKKAYVYGSPWSGKLPCYKNERAEAGAFVMLEQKPYNKITRQNVVAAFSSLISSCSLMIWDKGSYDHQVETMSSLIASVPVFRLECLPDEAAAQLSYGTIARNQSSGCHATD